MADLCMIDNKGRRVERALPHMQSAANLREMILAGDQVAECFAEIKRRNERVRYVRTMLASQFGEASDVG